MYCCTKNIAKIGLEVTHVSKIVKVPLKEVNIQTIPTNRLLEIGTTQKQRVLCEKSIKQYGLIMPIVTVEDSSGHHTVLKGENELSVLKEMKVDKADVFVVSVKNKVDVNKAILLLSSMHRELNPIAEGMLLRELLSSGEYNQKQLAELLMKSESWLSKRLSLVEQLSDHVANMVITQKVCPTIAQNIARIPKPLQDTFANKICSQLVSKSKVEKLVVAFRNKESSNALRDEIINDPLSALEHITEREAIRIKSSHRIASNNGCKLESCIRLMLKLINESEGYLTSLESKDIHRYLALLSTLESSADKFLALLQYTKISLGKLNKN